MKENLLLIATLMSQELQEFIDEACESAGSPHAMAATQELLSDWNEAYKMAYSKARPAFHIDPDQPWIIRGGNLDNGLDTTAPVPEICAMLNKAIEL